MASWHLKTWPYPGPLGIREEQDVPVVDRWRHLGSAANESEIEELLLAGEPEFDLDIYKILKKHLGKANKQNIIDVTPGCLCLFPASLLHYTIPFESDEDRIVLAFDVLPK